MKAIFFLSLLSLSLISLAACSNLNKPPEPVYKGSLAETEKYIERFSQRQILQNNVSGLSLILIDHDKIVFNKNFGFADKERLIPASSQSLYRVGSISKLMTATRIMQLVEDKKISLDEPYQKYVPEFSMKSPADWDKKITLRHLLTHHAGVPFNYYKGLLAEKTESLTWLVQALKDESLANPPGTVYAYSNVGFALLGYLIEKVDHVSYAESIRHNILQPAGMNQSDMELNDSVKKNLAQAYMSGLLQADYPIRDVPAGGLYSSTEDLGLFARMMMSGGRINQRQILSQESIDEMWRAQNQDVPLDFDGKTGLAWWLYDEDLSYLGKLAIHDGSMPFYYSKFVIIPEQKVALIALSNSSTAEARDVLTRVSSEALRSYFATQKNILPPPMISSASYKNAEDLKRFEGLYSTDVGLISLDAKKNKLISQFTDYELTLEPVDHDKFSVKYYLFGLIPIDIDYTQNLFFSFQEVDGRKLIVKEKNNVKTLLGEKINVEKLNAVWEARLGRYRVINADKEMDLLNSARLTTKNGALILNLEIPSYLSEKVRFALTPISDNEASIPGLVRGSGDHVQFKKDRFGELLYFSGYQLRKIE